MSKAVADQVRVAVEDTGPSPRRSSIEKLPVLADSDFDDIEDDDLPRAFDKLPEEIIQQ